MKNNKVCLVSSNKPEVESLKEYVQDIPDFECENFENFDLVSFWKKNSNKIKNSLILWDYQTNDKDNLWMNLKICNNMDQSESLIFALYNLPYNLGLEKDMLHQGVRGVFYPNDSPELLQKGIKALLEGEIWFSRKLLSEFVLEKNMNNEEVVEKEDLSDLTLTSREEEILLMIAAGYSNSDIAESLCITASTVKTHVYNIFQKINVPNRLQAALWTVKNLSRKYAE